MFLPKYKNRRIVIYYPILKVSLTDVNNGIVINHVDFITMMLQPCCLQKPDFNTQHRAFDKIYLSHKNSNIRPCSSSISLNETFFHQWIDPATTAFLSISLLETC